LITSIPDETLSSHSFIEIFYSLQEAASLDDHDNVDGVKIFLAIKASGQVGVSAHSRVEVVTPRATEAKPFGGASYFQVQHLDDDLFNGDLIADHP
jgi:hypothetical protein